MNDDDQIAGYSLATINGQFEILNKVGRTVMVCRDKTSASHYLSLLNEAFQLGYKTGYRKGRNSV